MENTDKGKRALASLCGAARTAWGKLKQFFRSLPARIKEKFAGAREILTQGNGKVAASMCIMGLGQLLYRQWAKGILYLLVQIAFFAYFIMGRSSNSRNRIFAEYGDEVRTEPFDATKVEDPSLIICSPVKQVG